MRKSAFWPNCYEDNLTGRTHLLKKISESLRNKVRIRGNVKKLLSVVIPSKVLALISEASWIFYTKSLVNLIQQCPKIILRQCEAVLSQFRGYNHLFSAKNLIAILFSFQVSLFGKEEAVRKCQWKPQIRKCGGLLVWAVCTCRHGNGQKKIRKVRWGKKEHLCVCPSLVR